jgi:hypothetical protein
MKKQAPSFGSKNLAFAGDTSSILAGCCQIVLAVTFLNLSSMLKAVFHLLLVSVSSYVHMSLGDDTKLLQSCLPPLISPDLSSAVGALN